MKLLGLIFALQFAVSPTAFASEAAQSFTWQIVEGRLAKEQRLVKVQKGQTVQLVIASDQPGELHLHAYRLVVPVSKAALSKVNFKAHATGKFRFEWHALRHDRRDSDAKDDQLKGGNHHAEPIATLEVRPN